MFGALLFSNVPRGAGARRRGSVGSRTMDVLASLRARPPHSFTSDDFGAALRGRDGEALHRALFELLEGHLLADGVSDAKWDFLARWVFPLAGFWRAGWNGEPNLARCRRIAEAGSRAVAAKAEALRRAHAARDPAAWRVYIAYLELCRRRPKYRDASVWG